VRFGADELWNTIRIGAVQGVINLKTKNSLISSLNSAAKKFLGVWIVLTATQSHALLTVPKRNSFPSSPSIWNRGPNQVAQQSLVDLDLGFKNGLSAADRKLIDHVLAQAQVLKEQPQTVATLGGVEVLPLVCGQFKLNLQAVKGLGAEIEPCLDPSTGKSYVMTGGSFSPASTLSLGLQVGIYLGPAHLNQPVVGQYAYASLSKELIPFVKGHGQVSLSSNCLNDLTRLSFKECQMLVMGGAGLDFAGLFSKLTAKAGVKDSEKKIAVAGIEAGYGVIFQVKEHPWYAKIKAGASWKDVF
jgi:hypothetical protein